MNISSSQQGGENESNKIIESSGVNDNHDTAHAASSRSVVLRKIMTDDNSFQEALNDDGMSPEDYMALKIGRKKVPYHSTNELYYKGINEYAFKVWKLLAGVTKADRQSMNWKGIPSRGKIFREKLILSFVKWKKKFSKNRKMLIGRSLTDEQFDFLSCCAQNWNKFRNISNSSVSPLQLMIPKFDGSSNHKKQGIKRKRNGEFDADLAHIKQVSSALLQHGVQLAKTKKVVNELEDIYMKEFSKFQRQELTQMKYDIIPKEDIGYYKRTGLCGVMAKSFSWPNSNYFRHKHEIKRKKATETREKEKQLGFIQEEDISEKDLLFFGDQMASEWFLNESGTEDEEAIMNLILRCWWRVKSTSSSAVQFLPVNAKKNDTNTDDHENRNFDAKVELESSELVPLSNVKLEMGETSSFSSANSNNNMSKINKSLNASAQYLRESAIYSDDDESTEGYKTLQNPLISRNSDRTTMTSLIEDSNKLKKHECANTSPLYLRQSMNLSDDDSSVDGYYSLQDTHRLDRSGRKYITPNGSLMLNRSKTSNASPPHLRQSVNTSDDASSIDSNSYLRDTLRLSSSRSSISRKTINPSEEKLIDDTKVGSENYSLHLRWRVLGLRAEDYYHVHPYSRNLFKCKVCQTHVLEEQRENHLQISTECMMRVVTLSEKRIVNHVLKMEVEAIIDNLMNYYFLFIKKVASREDGNDLKNAFIGWKFVLFFLDSIPPNQRPEFLDGDTINLIKSRILQIYGKAPYLPTDIISF